MIKRIAKPWGYELLFAQTKKYAGKLLFVRRGEQLSYQYHKRKEETIFLYKGRLRIIYEKNGQKRVLHMEKGEAFHIPPGMKHRFHALSPSYIFEVSTPQLEDVVRLEDKYGRS